MRQGGLRLTSKEIICTDALDYLSKNKCPAIIASPPDATEINMSTSDWEKWFSTALDLCFLSSDGPLVFYVTDRMDGGAWMSKSNLVLQSANKARVKQAWHKIALRRDPMQTDIHRPTYSHLMAFNGSPKKRTPDVFPRGKVLYPNGMGLIAARYAVEWVKGQADLVVDPFCGRGTVPAVAKALGLDSIGIDIDPQQCEFSKSLSLKSSGN